MSDSSPNGADRSDGVTEWNRSVASPEVVSVARPLLVPSVMAVFQTILVGIDFNELSEVALAAAASIADRFRSTSLHLVHAIELLPYAYSPAEDGGRALASTWAELSADAAKRIAEHPVPRTNATIRRLTRVGPPARELADEAQDKHADLIVIASHDRGSVSRVILGSVASTLLRVAPCPVLVVGKDRPGTMPIRRVLAAVDLSSVSARVVENAMRIALSQKAELTVLSLYALPLVLHGRPLPLADPKEIAKLEAAHRARVEAIVDPVRPAELDVRIEVMRKAPAHNAILDVAEILPADLIVVGTSGHNAWQRFFLGSTATRVVTTAPCPVLCVPQ
jgi:nucleotide-binding universal stress UspA family protein